MPGDDDVKSVPTLSIQRENSAGYQPPISDGRVSGWRSIGAIVVSRARTMGTRAPAEMRSRLNLRSPGNTSVPASSQERFGDVDARVRPLLIGHVGDRSARIDTAPVVILALGLRTGRRHGEADGR